MTLVGSGLWRWHAGALLLYAAASVGFIDHGQSLAAGIVGQGSDPFAFIWMLAWWPWAFSHHLNPLYTDLVWQPLGVYLPWVASLPLLSLVGAPVTSLAGPVVTYNLLVLLAPVGAAWIAYFLCLRLAKAPPAALVGGYLFGFSAYEMAQDAAALNLSTTLLVPALLLLVLKRLDDELRRPAFALGAGLLLIGQFMISTEVFALVFLFGGMAWGLALASLPTRRPGLKRLFVDGLSAAPLVLAGVSPFLIVMFRHFGFVNLPAAWPYFFTADLVNVVVPAPPNLIGGDLFRFISKHFPGGAQEQDAYIGVPLLLIIGLFARRSGRQPAGRLLVTMFLVLLIASFGPHLWLAGYYSPIGLPWALFVKLPLIGSALPARFALFVSLAVAMIVALWLAAARPPGRRRAAFGLALLGCLAVLPRPLPWRAVPHSRFFQPGIVQAALGANPRLLVLPFSINGPSPFWQQDAGFSFALTGGYLGFPPAAMQHFAAVGALFGNVEPPDFLADLREFLGATHTQYIVAGPGTPPPLLARLAQLNWPSRRIEDVTVFTIPPGLGANVPD